VSSVRVLISRFAEIPVEEEESGDEEAMTVTESKKDVSKSQYSRSRAGN